MEHFIRKIKIKFPESLIFDVCLVKISEHKKRKIIINENEMIFIKNNFDNFQINKNEKEEKCIESLFKTKLKKGIGTVGKVTQENILREAIRKIIFLSKMKFYQKPPLQIILIIQHLMY